MRAGYKAGLFIICTHDRQHEGFQEHTDDEVFLGAIMQMELFTPIGGWGSPRETFDVTSRDEKAMYDVIQTRFGGWACDAHDRRGAPS